MSVRATKSAPPTPPPAVKRMSAAAKPAPDEPCTKPLSREEVNAIVREHVLKMLNEGAAPDSLMASEVVRDLKPRYPDIRSSEVRSLFLQLRKEGVLTLLKPDLLQQACVLALPTQEEAKTIEEFIVKEMLGKGIPKDEILPLDVFNAIRPNHPLISINTIRIIMSRMRDNGIIERPSPVSLKRMNCQNKILDEETKYEDEVRRAKEDIARWEQDTQTVQCEYGQFHTLKVRSFADRMDRNACLIRLTEDLAIPYTESRSAGRAIVSVFQKISNYFVFIMLL